MAADHQSGRVREVARAASALVENGLSKACGEALMALSAKHVTFDCADPRRLADFWAEVVGGSVKDDWGEFVTVVAEKAGVAHLAFGKVPERKEGKNRVHIDFRADDRHTEVERVVALGAAIVAERNVGDLEWTVLQDPEGNEFCIANN
jgi:predicted enzyme related to lactoylglutathione lyase